MCHALALGADGVQVGTRFVATEECDAPKAYKEAYIQAQKEDICIIKSGNAGKSHQKSVFGTGREEYHENSALLPVYFHL